MEWIVFHQAACDPALAIEQVRALVASVIQFNRKTRPHGFWLADQEVHILAVDPIICTSVFIWTGHKENVGQCDLGTDGQMIAHHIFEH